MNRIEINNLSVHSTEGVLISTNIKPIPMLQGTALLMGFMFVLINTLVDISYYLLDPRQREDQ